MLETGKKFTNLKNPSFLVDSVLFAFFLAGFFYSFQKFYYFNFSMEKEQGELIGNISSLENTVRRKSKDSFFLV